MVRGLLDRIRALFRPRPLRYLASGECVPLPPVRRHWSVLAKPFFQMVGVVIAALLVGSIFSPNDGNDFIDTLAGVVTVIFFLRFLFYVWLWAVNRIVVTDQRIIEESGVFNRKVASMPLTKVTDLEFHRSLMGRIVGYGQLNLESAGQKQAIEKIEHLANPDRFYADFTTLLAGIHGAPPPPPPISYELPEDKAEDEDDTGPLPRVIV
jgi:membrane protein YdbS with pleckstrin-like domain